MLALKRKLAGVLSGAILATAPALSSGAELLDVSVELKNDRYRLYSETRFDVSQEAMFAVISDFAMFEHFTGAIVESKNLPNDDTGRPGFYTRMEGCVLMWCKSFIREGYVLLSPVAEIIAVANPDVSDFKFSRERWQMVPDGDGIILIYDFEMEPDFWVPPVIGPYMIQRTLKGGAERAVIRIEALALAQEELNLGAENPYTSDDGEKLR